MWSMAAEDLAVTFEISAVQASIGSGILMAGYAVGSYVEATLTNKIGYRGAGLLGLVLMVIGTIGIPPCRKLQFNSISAISPRLGHPVAGRCK